MNSNPTLVRIQDILQSRLMDDKEKVEEIARITQRKRRVVHFSYGERAYCGTPGVGNELVLTEEDPDESTDVNCARCLRKWGLAPAEGRRLTSKEIPGAD